MERRRSLNARTYRGLLGAAAAAGLCATLLTPATALAATSPCGESSASGWTAAASFSDITAAISSLPTDGSVSVYLTAPITETGSQLSLPSGDQLTLDLCGENLSITGVPAGDAAIEVPEQSALTVEDSSSTVLADQGTLTAEGGSQDSSQSGGAGAGIGGDGSAGTFNASNSPEPGESAGSVTITGGTVDATGGSGGTPPLVDPQYGQYTNESGGGGAGIGGGGAGAWLYNGNDVTGAAGGTGATLIVSGGAVVAQGGAANGETSGGGAAGIGGGGGGDLNLFPDETGGTGGAGGASAATTISGGSVTATGGSGVGEYGIGGGGGAGVGGGGGGYELAAGGGGTGGAGGAAGATTLSGTGSLSVTGSSAYTAGIGSGGDNGPGYGGGGGAQGTTTYGADGASAALTASSGTPGLSGELTGPLQVAGGATLDVTSPLTLDGSGADGSTNAGTIDLTDTTIDGAGTLDNAGAIAQTGSAWGVGTLGPGGNSSSSFTLTGNAYAFTFDVGTSASPAPSGMDVLAPTFAASGQELPAGPTPDPGDGPFTAWETASGTAITAQTPLTGETPIATGTNLLTAHYAPGPAPRISARLSSTANESKYGWWRVPVTVTFTCHAGAGTTVSCPPAVHIRGNGVHAAFTQKVTASNGVSGSVRVGAIKIDSTTPQVKIIGVVAGKRYPAKTPIRCEAHDPISGIAGCRFKRTVAGHTERVTATAVSRAGVSEHATVTFVIK